jgi:hypothetical protein
MDEVQNPSIIQKLLSVYKVLDDRILKFISLATYIKILSHFFKYINTFVSYLFYELNLVLRLLNFKAQYREFIIAKEFGTFQPDLLLLRPIIHF